MEFFKTLEEHGKKDPLSPNILRHSPNAYREIFGHHVLPPVSHDERYNDFSIDYLSSLVPANESGAHVPDIHGATSLNHAQDRLRFATMNDLRAFSCLKRTRKLYDVDASFGMCPSYIESGNQTQPTRVGLYTHQPLENELYKKMGATDEVHDWTLCRPAHDNAALKSSHSAQEMPVTHGYPIHSMKNTGFDMLLRAAVTTSNSVNELSWPRPFPDIPPPVLQLAPTAYSHEHGSSVSCDLSVLNSAENRRLSPKQARHNRMMYLRSKRLERKRTSTPRPILPEEKVSILDTYEKRRIRNRESVQKCRKRKKERAELLEMERNGLHSDNAVLKEILLSKQLRQAYKEARSIASLLNLIACDSGIVQSTGTNFTGNVPSGSRSSKEEERAVRILDSNGKSGIHKGAA